ncbi:MAG: pyridoxal phosphate-dependent aminotransferase [Pseudomonadales bacterium]|nr:pyridoxal phosphate-dependent aminotransferase [Pseudomonadales bacterium]
MTKSFATRLGDIQPFRVMELLARANALQAAGHQVIHMEVGEPDFSTPEPIIRAGERALHDGQTRYTPAQGIPALREAISRHYQDTQGVDVAPERIFVTAGGSGALLLCSALLLDPGQGLLMTDPGYPCNRHFLKAFSGEGQLVPVTASERYQLTPELIDRYWADNTRGVMLASPSNPTGAMLSSAEMAAIAETVRRRQGFLVADEIYHGLTYDEPAISALVSDPDAFVVNSFSKYFGMTGWRLGWLVVPDNAIRDVEKLAQNLFICPSSISQSAALAAFTAQAKEIMERQKEEFRQRRDFLAPALAELGVGVPLMPDGAFYVYGRLGDGLPDSETFCHRALEEQFVAVTPGTDFGFHEADRHVRFSYAQQLDLLEQGVERIAAAIRNQSGTAS